MKHVILGTAGHIDHGKTALIRALTGIDTDRLKEEKERGISIDLGFAHLDLPGELRIGVVDVPGHERFVKNMLAGAGGIDAVMLVVAADEGVMPQTREHVAIVELLGVTHGVIALTKRDLVDEEWMELASGELRSYLAGTALAAAPILPVSAVTGEGLDELRAALGRLAAGLPPRPDAGPARLPVDRVFSVEGFGTVVTGTLWSGRIAVGDRLVMLPGDREVRVRNVQVHEASVPAAVAGQRTAVALHGIERGEIERGHVLASPGFFEATLMIDARVQSVRDLATPLENRQRVRFHLGAAEVLARIVLLESDQIAAGRSALVEFRLESPVVAHPGDRFVVRSYSPMRTVAGGTVIDLPGRKRRRFREEELASLATREKGSGEDVLLEHLRTAALRGMNAAELERAASLAPGEAGPLLESLESSGRAVRVTGGRSAVPRWFDRARMDEVESRIAALLDEHRAKFPLRWGLGKEEIRSRLPKELAADVFQLRLEHLAASGRLQLRRDRVRGGADDLVLPAAAERAAADLLARYESAGMAPPTVAEVSASWPHRGIDLADLLELLAEGGDLTRVAPDLHYFTRHLETARAAVLARIDATGEIGVPDFKALFGISRKWAVPLLEMFDREGTTRRVGDKRVRGRTA